MNRTSCLIRVVLAFNIFFAFAAQMQADETHPSAGIDFARLGTQLQGEGLEGWVHGIAVDQGLAVFTWRDPRSFFTSAEFPMVSHIPNIAAQLRTLHRHDKVRLKGQFIQNGAPQRHIYVTELTVLEPFADAPAGDYQYSVTIPNDLVGQSQLVAKVHAVDANGHVLVIEWKDAVLPVFVASDAVAQRVNALYRGDKIRLHYALRGAPVHPDHLEPDSRVAEPIEVITSLVATHDRPADITGTIVKFPRSPQVLFDVYAIQTVDADGFTLDYTLINFDDTAAFEQIRAKMAEAFQSRAAEAINGRNKLIIPGLRVRAVGRFNVVSPSQANPQILLNGPQDITVLR